jgi:hypothetical protein
LRQYFDPRFTAKQIFDIHGDDALPLVRELGIANFAAGAVGILSLLRPDFVLPSAIAAAIFYGLAGFWHAAQPARLCDGDRSFRLRRAGGLRRVRVVAVIAEMGGAACVSSLARGRLSATAAPEARRPSRLRRFG